MAIPNTIARTIPSGISGEVASDYPVAAVAAVVAGDDNANAGFGRVYTYADTAKETVQPGGDGEFAGIAINPKAYAGEDGKLAVGQAGEFLFGGEVFVNCQTAGDIGDALYYVEATGCITTAADNGKEGAEKVEHIAIPSARVVRHVSAPAVSGLGRLTIIRLTN